jgi:hypothetical protein
MQYGNVTAEEARDVMVSMGFRQVMRQEGHQGPTRFVITGEVETNEFRKDVGEDVAMVRVVTDVDCDQHVCVRMQSESATAVRFIIMGQPGRVFEDDVNAVIQDAVENPRPWPKAFQKNG